MADEMDLFNPWGLFSGLMIPHCLKEYGGLRPSSKLIWGQLVWHAGETGRFARPSQDTLARELGMSRRGCQNGLLELQEKGFIVKLGMHRKNVLWGFVEHSIFKAHILRSSTLGLAHIVRRSRSTDKIGAECALGSAQNVRSTGAQCALETPRYPIHELSHEDSHGKGLPEPAAPESKHAPNKRACELLEDLFVGGRAGENEYADLTDLIDEFGVDRIVKELEFIRTERPSVRRRGVLPYIGKCLRQAVREEADHSVDGNWR